MAATLNDAHVVKLIQCLSQLHDVSTTNGSRSVCVNMKEPAVAEICQQSDLFEAFALLRSLKIVKTKGPKNFPGTFFICDSISKAAATVELPDTPIAVSEKVMLFGPDKPPTVFGKVKRTLLSRAQHDVIKALIESGEDGLTKDTLISKSGRSDPRGILRRLMEKDRDWKRVIRFPGKPGRGYRIH